MTDTPFPARSTLGRAATVLGIVATLFSILGAGGGAAMSTGKLTQRVQTLEQQAHLWREDHDRLIRIETILGSIKEHLEKEDRR